MTRLVKLVAKGSNAPFGREVYGILIYENGMSYALKVNGREGLIISKALYVVDDSYNGE